MRAAKKPRQLNPRQQKFAELVGAANMEPAEAFLQAGYPASKARTYSASKAAGNLLQKTHVLAAVARAREAALAEKQAVRPALTPLEVIHDVDRIFELAVGAGPSAWSVAILTRLAELKMRLLGLEKPEPEPVIPEKIAVSFVDGNQPPLAPPIEVSTRVDDPPPPKKTAARRDPSAQPPQASQECAQGHGPFVGSGVCPTCKSLAAADEKRLASLSPGTPEWSSSRWRQ